VILRKNLQLNYKFAAASLCQQNEVSQESEQWIMR